GSGKSTLIKCLAGVHQPDGGEMLFQGRPVTFRHPLDARAAGVATIFQEFSLVPTLTVAENVFLGRQPRRAAGTRFRYRRPPPSLSPLASSAHTSRPLLSRITGSGRPVSTTSTRPDSGSGSYRASTVTSSADAPARQAPSTRTVRTSATTLGHPPR
ncbi:MAG: sugar ABC transporter ATP-binding protein, partial [Planctomycetaceae bacterium]|nr:sugar ABC transporter ATP-binding protein [Planctomycetaceae bacterium]